MQAHEHGKLNSLSEITTNIYLKRRRKYRLEVRFKIDFQIEIFIPTWEPKNCTKLVLTNKILTLTAELFSIN